MVVTDLSKFNRKTIIISLLCLSFASCTNLSNVNDERAAASNKAPRFVKQADGILVENFPFYRFEISGECISMAPSLTSRLSALSPKDGIKISLFQIELVSYEKFMFSGDYTEELAGIENVSVDAFNLAQCENVAVGFSRHQMR